MCAPDERAVLFCNVADCRDRRDVAVHAVDAFGNIGEHGGSLS